MFRVNISLCYTDFGGSLPPFCRKFDISRCLFQSNPTPHPLCYLLCNSKTPTDNPLFVLLLWCFSFDDHSVSYFWYTMNCYALTTILYLDKACMGESKIPMTFHARLKEENINNQANFIISAQWYKTLRVTLNSCIFQYLNALLDRYRKIHSFKDPLNITYHTHWFLGVPNSITDT